MKSYALKDEREKFEKELKLLMAQNSKLREQIEGIKNTNTSKIVNQQHNGSGDNVGGDKIVYEYHKLFSEKILTNLPEKNEVFIGRKQESLDILEKVSRIDIPLVLVGIGGVGKTTLLMRFLIRIMKNMKKLFTLK
ncbi:MAG TPA: ATP-binding protein [Campylobacterales bacterium]|nr:ATP-binding protein [Campylobacterales bacterium]